ncbi:MAG TPA: peptidylprolyl isomerase, partial [Longimicrobiales bacterium]|nr:peptidylprolyl isomerase [Longimicrobiales bacterium]
LYALTGTVSRPDGVRTAALTSWLRIDAATAAPVAAQWADSARWILRLHAARALAQAPWIAALSTLQPLTRDPNYLVAAAAFGSLRAVADSTIDVRRIFVEGMIRAEHPLVRAAAIGGIAANPTTADLDILLQAYDRARQDSIRDAAAAAVAGLGRLRRAGTPAERSFFLRFGQFGPPADIALYRAIDRELGTPPQWTPPAARPEPKPLEFYVDIVQRYVAPDLERLVPPHVVITTQHGEIVIALAGGDAPLTVHNFLSLIDRGYYANTRWHRVVPNFVIQDGDPRGDGSGGPGYAIRDEINALRYDRGALGMALSGPDTGGSQWFITHSPQPHLDGGYTIFGRVVSGMDVVDRVVQEEPILSMRRAQ